MNDMDAWPVWVPPQVVPDTYPKDMRTVGWVAEILKNETAINGIRCVLWGKCLLNVYRVPTTVQV
jgi:hypothetical protein